MELIAEDMDSLVVLNGTVCFENVVMSCQVNFVHLVLSQCSIAVAHSHLLGTISEEVILEI
jgi:hypothetical protein